MLYQYGFCALSFVPIFKIYLSGGIAIFLSEACIFDQCKYQLLYS